jgi:hypothetical protein
LRGGITKISGKDSTKSAGCKSLLPAPHRSLFSGQDFRPSVDTLPVSEKSFLEFLRNGVNERRFSGATETVSVGPNNCREPLTLCRWRATIVWSH